MRFNWQFALLIMAVVFVFPLAGRAAAVRGWEGTIELPIYLLGEEDPNPPFQLSDRDDVYPYTMIDDITDHREPKTYRAIFLENEFLKATILPELGGACIRSLTRRLSGKSFIAITSSSTAWSRCEE